MCPILIPSLLLYFEVYYCTIMIVHKDESREPAMNERHPKLINLFEAVTLLQSSEEAEAFFLDVCTPAEIKALSERWTVCQFLSQGTYSYRQISDMTGTSLTTIVRVARFLNDEPHGGYRELLKKCEIKNSES